jgi:amino acid adenylation domain-containing protein
MSAMPGSATAPGAAVDYDPFAGAPLLRVVPTTEPQREVWLADQLGRDASLAFNESVSLRLRGALHVDALHAAVSELVIRRDALRANFGPDGETLCILAGDTFAITLTDLSRLDPVAAERAMQAAMREAVETPFDLIRGPLFRATLLRLGEADHVLLLTAHHIVCDGWSWWLIVRELGALYAQHLGQGEAALAPSAAFADYALAQATASRSATLAADETYWLARFADGAPVLDLPPDRPRPAQRSFASAREDHVLDATLVAAVRRLGGRHGASLFAALLAGFAGVLARLSGQDDVVIGIPAAGQSVDEHDDIVGHCVNLLPLRCRIDPAQPFGVLLDATQNSLLDALDHQRYTYGELLKKLRVARDPSRLPLVSVMFNIDQALDQESTAFPGLSIEFASNPRSHENFELFINAVQVHGALRLECQYNRDLFDAATVRRWLAAYEQLLRTASERADAAFATLSWLDAPARAELLALQPAASAFDRECAMHMHFERQCDQTPERIALWAGDSSVSYAQLEARANRIAHLLRTRGVHRGTLVGLALDRGIDMVAALLGILKSGAGYVPLDPGFPAERLAYMASDAGLAALVTQGTYADTFDLRGRPVLALDQLDCELADASAERIGADTDSARPESIAYVIYTSGSTGRPKGVSVPHRAVANFIHAMRIAPGVHADDRLLAVTTLSFDIAVLELLLPLSVGARVILADRDTAIDGGALMRLLALRQATLMQATPATWRMLLEAGWQGDPTFTVLCGGEALSPELASQLLPRCGALWNLYGPTETTVWSTCARVQAPSKGALPDVYIGRPIANTLVWILDRHGTVCPRGVPGEICIGGDGVSLGYLHRPELTAERFIADPFAVAAQVEESRPSPLLYRTGDRGRWRGDGNLEHLGRLDFQVKVRGYRIELGEIESALLTHPDVANALLMAREDRPGDARLVAYVVARTDAAPVESALLAHLRSTLPEYMIPQHVVVLAAMPLLPNGKVDRKALPSPIRASRASSEEAAPRTPLELQITTAMADVLGLPCVGIHDDFFLLGGHSLLAAKLTTRLGHDLKCAFSMRVVFDFPTAARLASAIGEQSDVESGVTQSIPRREAQGSAPLTPLQDRIRMVEAFYPGTLAYNTPSAHRLTGKLDVRILERAFQEMMARQTVLRTVITLENNEPVQSVKATVETGLLRVEDLTALPPGHREPEVARRMQSLIDTPFDDLGSAPLFRARIYKIEDEVHVLFFMPHHIIWDGWSFDLMYAEMSEIYGALSEGCSPALPALPVTYGDYAAWLRGWMDSDAYRQQVAFWTRHLSGPSGEAHRLAALPTDKRRKRGLIVASESLDVSVPGEACERLQAISNRFGVTLFTVLLTAFSAVLSRLAGTEDIVVGTLVRGRNRFEVENLMGYFTNLLPLRLTNDASMTFATSVKRTRDVLLDGFANPDIRIEDLPNTLSLRNEVGAAMFYHAQFSFQDVRQRPVSWGALKHSRIEVLQPGASEDIALLIVENESGLTGSLVYNSNLFDARTIRLMRDRFQSLLQKVSIDPGRRMDSLIDASAAREVGAIGDVSITRDAFDAHIVAGDEREAIPHEMDPRDSYLAGVWSQILATVVVPSDNFFDLGGNSMLAVQMAERVMRETGFKIKILRLASQSLSQIAADFPAGAETPMHASSARPGFARRLRSFFSRTRPGGIP